MSDSVEEHMRRVMAWDLRVTRQVAWWERLIERVLPYERWEWKTPDGRWIRYWRRDGSLPA